MIVWILFISFLSFVFIYIIHQIFLFFKSTLTTPKIKDYIYSPTKKYDEIYQTISGKSTGKNQIYIDDTTLINDLNQKPNTPLDTMKDDLKSFLKNQLQSNNY